MQKDTQRGKIIAFYEEDTQILVKLGLTFSQAINVSIQINPTKIGHNASAHFNLAFLIQNSISTVVDAIANIPEVTLILKTSGMYDLSAKAMTKDPDQLLALQDKIASIEGVTKLRHQYGTSYMWMPFSREYIS